MRVWIRCLNISHHTKHTTKNWKIRLFASVSVYLKENKNRWFNIQREDKLWILQTIHRIVRCIHINRAARRRWDWVNRKEKKTLKIIKTYDTETAVTKENAFFFLFWIPRNHPELWFKYIAYISWFHVPYLLVRGKEFSTSKMSKLFWLFNLIQVINNAKRYGWMMQILQVFINWINGKKIEIYDWLRGIHGICDINIHLFWFQYSINQMRKIKQKITMNIIYCYPAI